jgi:hypothetical protein
MTDLHHETSDVNVRGVFAFGAGLLATSLLVFLAVWILFQYFSARETARIAPQYPLATSQSTQLPPEPRLQTNPREDLRELRSKEDQVLTSYGWVDRNAGVVRIPIEQAMKLAVERGLAARP